MAKKITVLDCINGMTYIGSLKNNDGNEIMLENYMNLLTNSDCLQQYVGENENLANRLNYVYNNVEKTSGEISLKERLIVARYDIDNS